MKMIQQLKQAGLKFLISTILMIPSQLQAEPLRLIQNKRCPTVNSSAPCLTLVNKGRNNTAKWFGLGILLISAATGAGAGYAAGHSNNNSDGDKLYKCLPSPVNPPTDPCCCTCKINQCCDFTVDINHLLFHWIYSTQQSATQANITIDYFIVKPNGCITKTTYVYQSDIVAQKFYLKIDSVSLQFAADCCGLYQIGVNIYNDHSDPGHNSLVSNFDNGLVYPSTTIEISSSSCNISPAVQPPIPQTANGITDSVQFSILNFTYSPDGCIQTNVPCIGP